MRGATDDSLAVAQLWCGLLVAFFACLRISDLLALTNDDDKVTTEESGVVFSILIRGSKTDQEKCGVTRALRANHTTLCPVKAMQSFLSLRISAGVATCTLFPSSFRAKLVQVMKWAALENGVPGEVANTHPLRAGGATSLFVSCIDWVAIQRWERWKSCILHEYIRRGLSGVHALRREDC